MVLPLLIVWLVIMTFIWLFLLGWARIVSGHFFPTEIAMTVLMRDSHIAFDPDGTLRATTGWISKHDEGLAELLKNVRYAYLPNRANVDIKQHVAAVLLVDGQGQSPARIGVLDVGGATLDDLTRWSVWQDQHASLADGSTPDSRIA